MAIPNRSNKKPENISRETIQANATIVNKQIFANKTSNINKKNTQYTKNFNTRSENKSRYAKQLIQEALNKTGNGTLEQIEAISYKVLDLAPEWFFDKYTDIVQRLTDSVQNKLSRNDKSALISKLKSDPTNIEIRQDAFYAINKEVMIYEGENKDIEYLNLDELDKKICLILVVNEICGLGPLEPLFRDTTIREIMCNGPYDIQVEIGGNVRTVSSCKFRDSQHLQNLINKLYNSVNKEITRTNPFERARLHDNSRVFAVHKAIAPEGPNLNIRRHTDKWTSPDQLMKFGSASNEVFEWLAQHINAGLSFVVNGGTSTGKTTMLAALCGFLPNDQRVITIEKNIEIKLPKSKLLAKAMECIPRKTGSNSSNEVNMRDLVECCTQMRPDIIVCGEIVAEEAYDLIQAANTGHQVSTSIHSNSSQDCVYRLMSLISQADLIKGKDAFELIASGIDFVVSVSRFPQDGSRKIVEIAEIGTECKTGENGVLYLPVYPIWKFEPEIISSNGENIVKGTWNKVGKISQERRDKHNLDYIEFKSLDQLKELYKEKKGEDR